MQPEPSESGAFSWTATHTHRLRRQKQQAADWHSAPLNPHSRACGALFCSQRHARTVITSLDACGWRKRSVQVSKREDGRLAVPVAPEGADVFDALVGGDSAAQVPSQLVLLLEAGAVEWVSGVRLGAEVALAALRKREPEGPEAPAFRYCELFAGIGGFRLALDALVQALDRTRPAVMTNLISPEEPCCLVITR